MKKFQIITLFSVSFLFFMAYLFGSKTLLIDARALKQPSHSYRTGDLIFQTNKGPQSKAVNLATHSAYSHVGMILKKDHQTMVLEAVQPVKITPLKEWIARGVNGQYEVLRARKPLEIKDTQARLDSMSEAIVGKPYDLLFEWSDEKWYCSELVWKVYKEVYGIELCKLKKLKDFDLTHPYVQRIMTQRYGANYPLDQYVVAPQDLYESSLLVKVP